MVESSPYIQELIKYFWIINNSLYDKLRLIVGCDELFDLPATPRDVVVIEKMAHSLGVPDDHIIHDSEADVNALKESYKKLRKASRGHT